MNNNIRLGLFALAAIGTLSLAACKTTDQASQETAPPAAQAAPADSMPSNMSMPTSASSGMYRPIPARRRLPERHATRAAAAVRVILIAPLPPRGAPARSAPGR